MLFVPIPIIIYGIVCLSVLSSHHGKIVGGVKKAAPNRRYQTFVEFFGNNELAEQYILNYLNSIGYCLANYVDEVVFRKGVGMSVFRLPRFIKIIRVEGGYIIEAWLIKPAPWGFNYKEYDFDCNGLGGIKKDLTAAIDDVVKILVNESAAANI